MNDEFCKTYIPYGMYRSVEIDRALYVRHPVRDASLIGCKEKDTTIFSTERCIPNGIQFQKFIPLCVIYFSFLRD